MAYAGSLGLAGLGLALLFRESAEADGSAHSRALRVLRERHGAALAAQLAPSPPIGLGVAAADARATAMMDVSDGLSLDAARLAEASGCLLYTSGAVVEKLPSGISLTAPNGLHGASIELPYPSVGATEQVLLTAVLAEGETELRNAAIEPEIIDLICICLLYTSRCV